MMPVSQAKADQVHVISHTHWDREWYLTREQYRLRLVDLIDAVLDRMDQDPRFRYFHLDGQTIVLGDYLEVRPDQGDRLRQRIAEGRLLVGPWYVMPDMFLVSGESLVRNLALGHRIAESFGGVMRAGYTPDPFGHVAQMPQILAGFGLDNAILWRGFGGPRAEYTWQGLDGTRVLLLHFPKEGYCNAFRLPLLPAPARREEAAALVSREQSRSSVGAALLMAGVDHTEPHPELLTMMDEIGASGVTASLSTLPAYVNAVRASLAAAGAHLEVVSGELRAGEEYSNLLPGVLSARTYLKKSNVRAQALLEKTLEPLALMAFLAGEPYPTGILAYAWKTLLENHPHDSICGCSIDEVHAENETRFARVLQVAEGQALKSLRALARRVEPGPSGSIRFLVVNTDLEVFDGVVEAVIDIPIRSAEPGRRLDPGVFEAPLAFFPAGSVVREVTDPEGRAIPFQEVGRESRIEQWTSRVEVPLAVEVERLRLVCDVSIPSVGFVALDARLGSGPALAASETAHSRSIENDVLRIEAAPDGTVNVLDKRTGITFGSVLEIEDVGDVGDEYNYSPPGKDLRVTSRGGAAAVEVTAAGALRRALRIATSLSVPAEAAPDRTRRAQERAALGVVIELEIDQGSPVVSGRVRLENTALDHRVRLLFPTGASSVAESRADSAFGVVSRPAQRLAPASPLPEEPVNAFPLQSFVDAGDHRAGMTVMSEGLMEYEVVGNAIALTLVRSVGWLSREDLATRRGNAGPSLATPGAQCLGVHEFRFAFAPRSTPPREAELYERSRNFLSPKAIVTGTNGPTVGAPLPARHSFLSIDCEPSRSVVLSALKKADLGDGIVLRVFNPGSEPVELRLSGDREMARVFRADLREQRHEPLPAPEGRSLLSLGARKIATLEF